jgi:predicted DsbA family dithiol-disulfide isomerase
VNLFAAPESMPRHFGRKLRLLGGGRLATAVSILFVAGAAFALVLLPRDGLGQSIPAPTGDEHNEVESFMAQARRIPLVIPRGGAKVLIVKFNDFQCPGCRESYLAYKPILAKYESEYPGAVRKVLKDFPLNSNCNPGARMTHPAACHAAVAVRLAREHGREEEMEEWLFSHQPEMTADTVRQAAREIGQVPDFDARYESTLELVKGDAAFGAELEIRSTPTFFINGVKVDGRIWPAQYFDQAIAYELQHPAAQ